MISYGVQFVFGVPAVIRPVNCLPAGCKARFRFRKDSVAFVFVRQGDQIAKHAIEVRDGEWFLGPIQALNKREAIAA
jgi:hypothetical protein